MGFGVFFFFLGVFLLFVVALDLLVLCFLEFGRGGLDWMEIPIALSLKRADHARGGWLYCRILWKRGYWDRGRVFWVPSFTWKEIWVWGKKGWEVGRLDVDDTLFVVFGLLLVCTSLIVSSTCTYDWLYRLDGLDGVSLTQDVFWTAIASIGNIAGFLLILCNVLWYHNHPFSLGPSHPATGFLAPANRPAVISAEASFSRFPNTSHLEPP
jgi:hypothetical protein